ncbi:hypothetical protein Nepgr_028568 [Nepenthes gracilis]|uniref:Fungal lipase-type domain-containing protein n=1 Tax=Nepenthes gracilis TaxID=150966 RepID=A0AAD3TBX9_NEPGR|nr:hypothetical protein Nepgr_028568 [Nepenthes gracilis]
MASEREDFNLSGLLHLTVVDWDNEHHRRSIAASLVSGVYVLERDRQEARDGPQALAPPWWEFFHFQLFRLLIDDSDVSIFGAIYEFEPKTSQLSHSKKGIPHYVIAFRGTLTKPDTVLRDLELDLHLIRNGLHKTSHSNIWLAGHSLGAAMAMLAGKNMATMGNFLECFLFNPPFFSAPIENIRDKKLKHGIRIAGSVITAGLALAASVKQPLPKTRSADPFTALSSWVPNIFVHTADRLCAEYIGYFEHREKMEQLGIGGIERLAAQHSFGGLVMRALGKDAEPAMHLLPSASLTVNMSPASDFKQAHGLQQWWRHDLQLRNQIYLY